MELKRLITHFTYRIEPKPEGGFIAYATDPVVPPLEAPTRDELQQKIQTNIAAALVAEFPGLKLPLENQETKFAFHIERKPGGGFAIHSTDGNAPSIEAGTHEEIESHFAEKLIAFLGKHFMPELSQALFAQASSGDVKVFVNRKMNFTLNTGSRSLNLSTARDMPVGSNELLGAKIENAKPESGTVNASFGSPANTVTNSSIDPETTSNWTLFWFLLAGLIVCALMYFFFNHR